MPVNVLNTSDTAPLTRAAQLYKTPADLTPPVAQFTQIWCQHPSSRGTLDHDRLYFISGCARDMPITHLPETATTFAYLQTRQQIYNYLTSAVTISPCVIRIASWCDIWMMKLYITKCKSMRISCNASKHATSEYLLNVHLTTTHTNTMAFIYIPPLENFM